MQTILMPIDFSDATERMVTFATERGAALDAEFCVLHASDASPDDPMQGRAVLLPKLEMLVDRLKQAGCIARAKLVYGPTIASILDQVDILKPSMIIVGSHGHGALHDLVVGSVTNSLLRSCVCPVLVVPVPRPAHEVDPIQADMISWDDTGYPIF